MPTARVPCVASRVDLYTEVFTRGGGDWGRDSCGGQRSTSFSHELGDAFQIFCCFWLTLLIVRVDAVAFPLVADAGRMVSAVRAEAPTVVVGVARLGVLVLTIPRSIEGVTVNPIRRRAVRNAAVLVVIIVFSLRARRLFVLDTNCLRELAVIAGLAIIRAVNKCFADIRFLLAVLFKVVAGVFPRTDALVLRRAPLAVPSRPAARRTALPVYGAEVRGRARSLRRDRGRGEHTEDERRDGRAGDEALELRLALGRRREGRGLGWDGI